MNRPLTQAERLNSNQASTAPAVPLPNEVPPPPDLSQLPSHILHSGTVDTLLGLNEDLMARLKVNIRRNSILEQQIMEHDRSTSELARINHTLTTQVQVLHEKERLWKEKTARAEESQENLRRLSAFQRRVRAWVAPAIKRLKSELKKEKALNLSLAERAAARDAQVSDLKTRLADATQHSQNLERQFSRNQTNLVNQHESQRKTMEADLEKLRAELKLTRDKALRLDEAVGQRTELENKIVYLERKLSEEAKAFQSELQTTQEQLAKYRSEAKVLAVETIEYDRKLKTANAELSEIRDANEKLQDQFESLQTVWTDAQKKLETAKLQHESLNRLNQELSRQLKEQRKAIEKSAQSVNPETALSNDPEAARMRKLDIIENDSNPPEAQA